jgi:signal transduction histidine kinase
MVVASAPAVTSPLGPWSVSMIGSAAEIDVPRRSFLWQLILTSVGVIAAMLLVGLVILRQQAAAAALHVRLQAAEELHSLQRQLIRAEKLVTVGVLSAGIAHEIGTPLQVIRGRAEHMLEQAHDRRAAEALRAIVSQIDRISSTIRQVLQFSRQQPIELGPADARDAVAKALELLDLRIAGKRLAVRVEAEERLPPVAAAADQLDQVVLNLLMNACDASSEGKSIEISLGRDAARGDCLRLAITDHGVGIPAENLHAVFDPYFTTKNRDEGTGLGLAIVSQIVHSHSGEIALKSALGMGTVATVLWPIVAAGGVHG